MATILVIDDTESVRGLMRTILESDGHTVLEATSGNEGIHLFQESYVDAVITDLHMTDGDGLDVIRALRGQGKEVGILAVSGAESGDRMLSTAQLLGADGILLKPFAVEEFVAAVTLVLGERKSRTAQPG
ncbi:MAG: spo0F [Nitrospira sp.]|jgi:DNA-binding response OmpR family regulator|nr:spo0F [Nitrospira sp.]